MNYDFESDRPIYIQLVEKLRTQIVSGELKKGEKMQSVRELAINAKVNPNTMQRALAELENEGLLYTERTSGRYVTTNEKLESFINELNKNEEIRIISFEWEMFMLFFFSDRKNKKTLLYAVHPLTLTLYDDRHDMREQYKDEIVSFIIDYIKEEK